MYHRLLTLLSHAIFLQPSTDTVAVSVNHLTLNEEAAASQDDEVKMLFIEYRFLNAPLEETETPYSLPKPEPHKQISFNFAKSKWAFLFGENVKMRLSFSLYLIPRLCLPGNVQLASLPFRKKTFVEIKFRA